MSATQVTAEDSIKKLGLSTYLMGVLHGHQIRTVGELAAKSREELLSLKEVGAKKADQIAEALSRCGLSFKS